MFAPFTRDEVESIRSIVLINQQHDDMLVSNCSTRPITQTRSFIRRFKNLLLDSSVTVPEITKSANEQYVSIIAGVRMKRNRQSRLANTTSVANLASSFMQTVPFKFRIKYARAETEIEQQTALPPPLPTRSRSVAEGLTLSPKHEPIPVLPPIAPKFDRGATSPQNAPPGTLAAVFRESDAPATFCRILGKKAIQGTDHLLVGFFQPEMRPCYVRPQQLVVFISRSRPKDWPNPITIDALLDYWIRANQSWIHSIQEPLPGGPLNPLLVRALTYAIHLSFLNFAANYVVPRDKLLMLLGLISKLNPLKYNSSKIISERSMAKIEDILASLG
jgi:hypothetical protein